MDTIRYGYKTPDDRYDKTVVKERNKSIFTEYVEGKTAMQIGKEYGITRTRVYQIVKAFRDDMYKDDV